MTFTPWANPPMPPPFLSVTNNTDYKPHPHPTTARAVTGLAPPRQSPPDNHPLD
ncbi:Hypothetical protein FKW44_011969 [Caligus rogercresseyi]|uniref:Uncharacterized protein n=1 Tax=Caligus rogercresseyi TaxID=217165 RepID=A0A7T8K8H6_CALRO|nr:Hypothetical protein FKW44_011969 [Caligus rogercresseyi]